MKEILDLFPLFSTPNRSKPTTFYISIYKSVGISNILSGLIDEPTFYKSSQAVKYYVS